MYIIVNMSRICQNKLVFWKQTCFGYTQCLGKAGLFRNIENLALQDDDIPIKLFYFEKNIIGLTMSDLELSKLLVDSNDILEITIDIDMSFRGKRIIEILRDIQK